MKYEDLNEGEKAYLALNKKISKVTYDYDQQSTLSFVRGNHCFKLVFKLGEDEFKIIGASLLDACERMSKIVDAIS